MNVLSFNGGMNHGAGETLALVRKECSEYEGFQMGHLSVE